MGAGDGPHLRIARRPRSRWNFGDVRVTFSRNRDSGCEFDVWHSGRPAACLPFGTDSGDGEVQDGSCGCDGGIALFYLLSIVLGFFGVHFTTINGSGPIGIGFSVVVVIVASLNLVLDFDFIESGVRAGAPKYMGWYAAFGLMVTLIWLYFEILRLLSKLRSRN